MIMKWMALAIAGIEWKIKSGHIGVLGVGDRFFWLGPQLDESMFSRVA